MGKRQRQRIPFDLVLSHKDTWKEHHRLILRHLAIVGIKHPFSTSYKDYKRNPNIFTDEIMAIRNDFMVRSINDKLRLKEPFPSAMSKTLTSKFGFYCYNDERFCFHNFHAAYAAQHFLEAIIQDRKVKWLDDNRIQVIGTDIIIRGEGKDDLDRALSHKMTRDESNWELPSPYPAYIATFLGKRRPVEALPAPAKPKREASTASTTPKAPKAKKPTGLVSIGDIAQSLNMHPRDARAMLRKLKIVKPDHGWAWPKDEADKIAKRISK